jgi:hypothetical protein
MTSWAATLSSTRRVLLEKVAQAVAVEAAAVAAEAAEVDVAAEVAGAEAAEVDAAVGAGVTAEAAETGATK